MTNIKAAIVIAAALLVALMFATRNTGVTWDEPIYLQSARQIIAFFQNFKPSRLTDKELVAHFDASQWKDVHPTFSKLLGAFTLALTGKFQSDLYAYRLGNMLLASIVAGFIFVFISSHFHSRKIGLLTTLVCLAMPRVTGQMEIGDTDTTLYLLSFPATIAGYLSANKRSWRWGIAAAILSGFCVATRYTGLVVPLGIFVWTFLYHRDEKGIYNLFFLPLISPVVFVLINPQFWKDPILRSFVYFARSSARHISEPHVGFMFDFFNQTPWFYAPILILTTVPILSLLFIFLGIAHLLRAGKDDLAGLFAILAVLPIAIILMPGNVAYDGVRMFLVSFLYLGLLSAWCFARYAKWIENRIAFAALLIALLLPPALAFPFELEYYGIQTGGLKGAASLGLELTYWWDAANPKFYEQANRILPEGSTVAMLPADKPFIDYYREKRLLHVDFVPPGKSDFVVMLCRPSCDSPRLKTYVGQWYKELQVELSYPNRDVPFVLVLRTPNAQ